MKTLSRPALLLLPLLVLFLFPPFQTTFSRQASISPTPTYDPLVEPPLPEHPTEYELGRNLYWHWCMTCHGDKGQGLTDEFRSIWEPDHQDCWGRGCHAGHSGDMGFPIPTVVPALVNVKHLAQFKSVLDLADFLKATHPPQSPGILKNEEYHAIALFVFTMNERPLVMISVTPTAIVIPTSTSAPPAVPALRTFPSGIVLILTVLLLLIFGWAGRSHLLKQGG